jgi:heme oxygenase (biliverdin-IX-beta and delta-forming)
LVAQISTGTLCTLAIEPAGYPYGSFVTVAFEKGNRIFLISALAEHTKNLEQDARASLLVAASGSADPLANGRVTMLRPCTRVERDGGNARAAFLAAHPNSTCYADFRDSDGRSRRKHGAGLWSDRVSLIIDHLAGFRFDN